MLRTLGEPWTGSAVLEWLDWEGPPRVTCDFALERPEYGAISQWTFLRGYWRLHDKAYHGSGAGVSETYTGDISWTDYSLTVRLLPLLGEHHNINVRVQGALRSYALGLAPEGQLVLYKNQRGYRPLAGAFLAWQHGRRYTLSLAAKGNHLLASVDGRVVLEWVDTDRPYLGGQVGLSNFQGCHTRYEHVRVD